VHREEEAAVPGAEHEKLDLVAIADRWNLGVESGMVDPRVILEVFEFGRVGELEELFEAVRTQALVALLNVPLRNSWVRLFQRLFDLDLPLPNSGVSDRHGSVSNLHCTM
jgi:hypothetical protein